MNAEAFERSKNSQSVQEPGLALPTEGETINVQDVLKQKRLAVNGGTPRIPERLLEDTGIVRNAADDVAAVVRSGRTQYWGGGPKAHEIEQKFAAYIGRSDAFFHSSGTAALQTALFAVGVEDGDPVTVSNSGFVASLNVIYHLRARPVFLPTNPTTLLVESDVSAIVRGLQPKASILTHFFGNVVDVEATHASSGARFLIEDGGQAHGAMLRGKPVGSYGDIGSFAGSHKKLVTAGQGGYNVFDDPDIGLQMRTYAHHGKGPDNIEHFAGFNFRGGEMEAVLALAALEELPSRVVSRNAAASVMRSALEAAEYTVAKVTAGLNCEPAWFDVPIILGPEWLGHRDELVRALVAEGVPAWTYPSLIGIPWVQSYMTRHGWWDDAAESLQSSEADIWGRVILIGTQFNEIDAQRLMDAFLSVMAGE